MLLNKKGKEEPFNYLFNYTCLLALIWIGFTIINSLIKGVDVFDKSLIKLVILFVLFLLTQHLMSGKRAGRVKKIFLVLILAGGSAEGVIGLLQLQGVLSPLNIYFPVTGTFRNPAPFALYLAAVFPLSLSVALIPEIKSVPFIKVLATGTCIVILSILPFTNIRASWIAVLTGAGVVIYFKYGLSAMAPVKRKPFGNKLFLRAVCIIILFLSLAGSYVLRPLSVAGRALVWKVSAQKFMESPLSGQGYSSFKKQYNRWQGEYFRQDTLRMEETSLNVHETASYLAGNVETAYNEYLEIGVESGIAGLFLFLSCVTVGVLQAVRTIRQTKDLFLIGSLGGLSSILMAGLFSYPLKCLPVLCLFFVFLAIVSGPVYHRSGTQRSISQFLHVAKIPIAIFSFLTGILLLHYSLRIFQLKQWELASVSFAGGDLGTAGNEYSSAYPCFCDEPLFLLDYSQCSNQSGEFKTSLQLLQKAKRLTSDPRLYLLSGQAFQGDGQDDSAVKEYTFAHYIQPDRLFPEYLLASLYSKQKDTLSAIYYAGKVIRSKPKVESGTSDRLKYEMEDLIRKYK